MGLSEACYLPAALALIADLHTKGTRSLATGVHQSGLYAGMAFGGVTGGWMGSTQGWRAPFLVLGVLGLLYAVVLVKGLREDGHRHDAGGDPATPLGASLLEVVRLPGYFGMLAAFTGLAVATGWSTPGYRSTCSSGSNSA